jgi:hypothetical protein
MPDMTDVLQEQRFGWKKQVVWELKWSSVEAAFVGTSLVLMLRLGLTELGTGLLFAFLCLDLVFRIRHYSKPRSRD